MRIQFTIECQYEIKSMQDMIDVGETVESALDQLRTLGSADCDLNNVFLNNVLVPTPKKPATRRKKL